MLFRRVLCLFVALVSGALALDDGDARLVNTAQGPVRGYRDPEGDLFAFYNIPYATAPTGVDRFKAPLPGPVWFQPFEAVEDRLICPQADFVIDFKKGKNVKENCLIANIYIPDTKETNIPVVVHVHGGGYQIGFGEMMKFKNLVRTKKVIVVNFNYRLGAHGFLCLGTKYAPGNAGMKDQVALLRWVKKNIANFGGNPEDVTIDGESAGSSAVDLLMLSKATKGLFNKVIPESGANVGVWSVQIDPLENAKVFARQLNFTDTDNVYALEEFYKTASLQLLTSVPFAPKADTTLIFTPCVERDVGEERFLEDTPVNILKAGKYKKVPILYGFANMEGKSYVTFAFDQFVDKMNNNFSDFLPDDLQFGSDKQKNEVAKKVKEFYFRENEIGEETVLSYIDYFTDVMFAYPTLRAVKLHVEAGHDKIYLYEYSYPDLLTPFVPKVLENVSGADHCAQSFAVADGVGFFNEDESNAPESYKKMKSIVREIWLNFMTTGKPVPEGSSLPSWPAVGAGRAPHMSLGETLRLRGALLERRVLFWDDIYEHHYRSPAPLPGPVWLRPFEAVDEGVICPQADIIPDLLKDKNRIENCLIANIYVPDTKATNLPVVVYVHGGAYQAGLGDMMKVKNLIKSKKIIAVNFNYRLGAHGFLCLGTKYAPGNAGMKDQVALLRWVKKNIANFGGNPEDITIDGGSAGSSAVDLLMLSKATKGLFNKVIPESGANVGVWSVQIDPLVNAKAFARQLNFTDSDDVYALEEFYKNLSFELLTSDAFLFRTDSTFVFSPSVERDIGVERFLEDTPVNILRKGKYRKVPILYGFANMEGKFRVIYGYEEFVHKMNKKFSDFLPADLQFDNYDQKEEVAKKVKEFYFGKNAIGQESILSYIDYFTDVMFAYPTLRAVKLHVEAGHDKIYLYEYSYPDIPTPFVPKVLENVSGADHCAQSAAVADGIGMFNLDESTAPEGYQKMKSIMREIWLNFMTTGKPVPEGSSSLPSWPAVGAGRAPHMSLGETLRLRGALLERRALFWDDIYERHYRSPLPPPQHPPRPHSDL